MNKPEKRSGSRPRCMESYKLGASASLRRTITHLESLIEGRATHPDDQGVGTLRGRLYELIEIAMTKPKARRPRGRRG